MPRQGSATLASVRQTADGGFVIDRHGRWQPGEGAAGNGSVNLVDEGPQPMRCRFHRDPLLGAERDKSPAGSKRWLQAVQTHEAGHKLFRNHGNGLAFYKELAYGAHSALPPTAWRAHCPLPTAH
jgi:hypothetical protein